MSTVSRRITVLTLVSLLLLSSFTYALAARKLPRVAPRTATTSKVLPTKGVTVKVRFRADRRAIIASFTNLSVASSVSYTLTYDSNGSTQGAGGSITPGTVEPIERELIFGTCSHGVCRYDTGIKNAKLVVITTLKSGKKISKSFKLKI